MTSAKIVAEFKKMSREEQLALIGTLASIVVEDEKPRAKPKRTLHRLYGALNPNKISNPKETPKQRAKRLASLPAAEEITGVIQTGKRAPTDEEVKKMYVDYLVEKYS